MSLLLIFTKDHCHACNRLDGDGFFPKLYARLTSAGISYKRLHAPTWNDFGVENGPRDSFHQKLKGWAPSFYLVPVGMYQDDKNVDDELLLAHTKAFNGDFEDGKFRPNNKHKTLDVNTLMEFVTDNHDDSLDTKHVGVNE